MNFTPNSRTSHKSCIGETIMLKSSFPQVCLPLNAHCREVFEHQFLLSIFWSLVYRFWCYTNLEENELLIEIFNRFKLYCNFVITRSMYDRQFKKYDREVGLQMTISVMLPNYICRSVVELIWRDHIKNGDLKHSTALQDAMVKNTMPVSQDALESKFPWATNLAKL